jgi:hypothetical protein
MNRQQVFGTYIFRSNSIIVTLDIPGGVGRSFRLDVGRNDPTPRASLYERAYSESDRWATAHGARLERFGPDAP